METIIKCLEDVDVEQVRATCSQWMQAVARTLDTVRCTIVGRHSLQRMLQVSAAVPFSSNTQLRVHPAVDASCLQTALSRVKHNNLQLLAPPDRKPTEAGALLGTALQGLLGLASRPKNPVILTILDIRGFCLSSEQLGQLVQLMGLQRLSLHVGVLDSGAVGQMLQLKALEELDCAFEAFDPGYERTASQHDRDEHIEQYSAATGGMLGCCVALLALPRLSSLSLAVPPMAFGMEGASSSSAVGGPFNVFVAHIARAAHPCRRMTNVTVRTVRMRHGELLEESVNRVTGVAGLNSEEVMQEVEVTTPANHEPKYHYHIGPFMDPPFLWGTNCIGDAKDICLTPRLTSLKLTDVQFVQPVVLLGLPDRLPVQHLKHLKVCFKPQDSADDEAEDDSDDDSDEEQEEEEEEEACKEVKSVAWASLQHISKHLQGLHTLELQPSSEFLDQRPCFDDDSVALLAAHMTQLTALKLHGDLHTALAGTANKTAWQTPRVTEAFSTYETSAAAAAAAATAAAAESSTSAWLLPAATACTQLICMPGKREQCQGWGQLAGMSSLRSLSLADLGTGKQVLLAAWLPTQLTCLKLKGVALISCQPAQSLPVLSCLHLDDCQVDTATVFAKAAASLQDFSISRHMYPTTLGVIAAVWPALRSLTVQEAAGCFVDLTQDVTAITALTRLRSLELGFAGKDSSPGYTALLRNVASAKHLRELKLQWHGSKTSVELLFLLNLVHMTQLRSLVIRRPERIYAYVDAAVMAALLRTCLEQTVVSVPERLPFVARKTMPGVDTAMQALSAEEGITGAAVKLSAAAKAAHAVFAGQEDPSSANVAAALAVVAAASSS